MSNKNINAGSTLCLLFKCREYLKYDRLKNQEGRDLELEIDRMLTKLELTESDCSIVQAD